MNHIHHGGFKCLGWVNKYHLAFKFFFESVYPTLKLSISIRTKETDHMPIHIIICLNRDRWSQKKGINAGESQFQLEEASKDNNSEAA